MSTPRAPRTRVGGLSRWPEPPNESRGEGRLMEWRLWLPSWAAWGGEARGPASAAPAPVRGAPGLVDQAGGPRWQAGRGATRSKPAVSWAGCGCDDPAQGLHPATLDVTLPRNGSPAVSLHVGREEEGPGRGRWAESGCTQGGVRGVNACRVGGARPETGACLPRPLCFPQSRPIEPSTPSPREQSPRPTSIFSAQGPVGREEQSLTQRPFRPATLWPPFSSLYKVL